MEKLFKIGEVAENCGTTIKTIRYYEKIGFIKPDFIDEHTKYRYYSKETLKLLQSVQRLKNCGLSLSDAKEFIKLKTVDEQFAFLNSKRSSIEKNKAELDYMFTYCARETDFVFINDKDAIGKWKCVAVAKDKECFLRGEILNEEPVCQILYLLTNGKGYEMLDGWAKGEIYYGLSKKEKWEYEIKGDLMFVATNDDKIQVYEKIDSKARSEAEQDYFDDVNVVFEECEEMYGVWQLVDCVHHTKKNSYVKDTKDFGQCFLKNLIFLANNRCVIDKGTFEIKKYTKGMIIDKKNKITMPYEVKEFDGKKHLILTWKGDSYKHFGRLTWCYVFEKIS